MISVIDRSARAQRARRFFRALSGVHAARVWLVLGLVASGGVGCTARVSRTASAQAQLKGIGALIRQYQEDHKGDLPTSLEALADAIPAEYRASCAHFVERPEGKLHAWLFFPRAAAAGGPKSIMMAMPFPEKVDRRSLTRAVLYRDLSTAIVDEGLFIQLQCE